MSSPSAANNGGVQSGDDGGIARYTNVRNTGREKGAAKNRKQTVQSGDDGGIARYTNKKKQTGDDGGIPKYTDKRTQTSDDGGIAKYTDGNNQVVQDSVIPKVIPKVIAPTTAEVSQSETANADADTAANRLLKIKKKGRSQSIMTSSKGVTKTSANYSLGKPSLLGRV